MSNATTTSNGGATLTITHDPAAVVTPAANDVTGDGKRTIVVPLDEIEFRDSGDPGNKNETTLRGHAAVFNSLSEDLGGFREIIEPGFFRAALRRKPDVRLLFNHDENHVMARTASGTLELREDNRGLHVFARVDKTIGWVADLRKTMQRGDIDQMSFAFTLNEGGDDWAVAEDGTVIRTLRADGAAQIFDASVVTYPAYQQTDVSMRGLLEEAIQTGRVSIPADVASDEIAEQERASAEVADDESSGPGEEAAASPTGEAETRDVEPDEPAGADTATQELREASRAALQEAKAAHLRLLREITK